MVSWTDKIYAKLISGGRVTIPKKFRKKLGLKTGDFILIWVERGGIRVVSAKVVERGEKK